MIPGIPYFKLIGVALIAVAVGGAIWYVKSLQATVETLQQNELKLKDSIDTQQQLIEQQINDQQAIRDTLDDISKRNEELNKEIKNVRTIFNKVNAQGKKRDFGKLGIAKPSRIEDLVNAATENKIRCLEVEMGRKLKEGEDPC